MLGSPALKDNASIIYVCVCCIDMIRVYGLACVLIGVIEVLVGADFFAYIALLPSRVLQESGGV